MGFFGYSSVSFTAGWTAPAISFQSCIPQKANGIRKLPTLLAYTERVIYRREEIKEEIWDAFLALFAFFSIISLSPFLFPQQSFTTEQQRLDCGQFPPTHPHTHTRPPSNQRHWKIPDTHTQISCTFFFPEKGRILWHGEVIYFQNKVGIKIRIVRTRTHARWM